jgi:hypothetical protein
VRIDSVLVTDIETMSARLRELKALGVLLAKSLADGGFHLPAVESAAVP